LPNAGKSTFLSRVSQARPKIADYPFTTLAPQLGMVRTGETDFVLADLPGLIEGAHEGSGLGDRFLGHAERCGVLLHLVDGTQSDITHAYHTIRMELSLYGQGLSEKPEIVGLNKIDAIEKSQVARKKRALEKASGKTVFLVSGVSGEGVPQILHALAQEVEQRRAHRRALELENAWAP
jgi:GTP-binding protein